jgi:hypothetical protein
MSEFGGSYVYVDSSEGNVPPIQWESIGALRKIVEGHDLVMQIKADAVIVYETRG